MSEKKTADYVTYAIHVPAMQAARYNRYRSHSTVARRDSSLVKTHNRLL